MRFIKLSDVSVFNPDLMCPSSNLSNRYGKFPKSELEHRKNLKKIIIGMVGISVIYTSIEKL